MIFLLDYIGRLFNSPRKKLSLKTHKLDSNRKNFLYRIGTIFDFLRIDFGFALCFLEN
ncbi:hypothetical protein LEP1GSC037_1595 [Leptospira interrogans str. 2006001854]|uniref:Uncharacterized protein n=1 Tax=Leptospira interrogans str. 2006001854 TaxID=1001590 RepID=M6G4A3_LEPIR|nr:hypothetical protein LEP1GSC037_1595 [Leptospira interrogans str. 2006001854]EMN65090.1 hypothetical protein LEP1GSC098_4034 [Leptospira interrogans serovar Grippotyphosa str. UI 08434]